ncbi:MAG: TylF/MycF/NovP-related O-methyltransferase [Terriglobales bacterium]
MSLIAEHVMQTPAAQKLYLDLLKACLTRSIFGAEYREIHRPTQATRHRVEWALYPFLERYLDSHGLRLVRKIHLEQEKHVRLEGIGLCEGETMIGLRRLDNLERCATYVLQHEIPCDFIETGVWRGGAAIFLRAVLKAYGDTSRAVWLADSFQGLPKPDPQKYPADKGDLQWQASDLAVSKDQVQANFRRYGLLEGARDVAWRSIGHIALPAHEGVRHLPQLVQCAGREGAGSVAGGCLLVESKQPVELEALLPYDGAYHCATIIRDTQEQPEWAAERAKMGCEYVPQHHRMELRFDQIFAKVGVACASS